MSVGVRGCWCTYALIVTQLVTRAAQRELRVRGDRIVSLRGANAIDAHVHSPSLWHGLGVDGWASSPIVRLNRSHDPGVRGGLSKEFHDIQLHKPDRANPRPRMC